MRMKRIYRHETAAGRDRSPFIPRPPPWTPRVQLERMIREGHQPIESIDVTIYRDTNEGRLTGFIRDDDTEDEVYRVGFNTSSSVLRQTVNHLHEECQLVEVGFYCFTNRNGSVDLGELKHYTIHRYNGDEITNDEIDVRVTPRTVIRLVYLIRDLWTQGYNI